MVKGSSIIRIIMKWVRFRIGVVGLVFITVLAAVSFFAPTTMAEEPKNTLEFTKFKIVTGSQFFEIKNTGEEEMSLNGIQLVYYNNYNVDSASSSKMISLSGLLQPGEYYLVNDSNIKLCYRTMVASASLGFSTTSGMVQLIAFKQDTIGGPFVSEVLDSVAWSRAVAASPVHVLPPTSEPNAFMQKTPEGWQKYQVNPDNPCEYLQYFTVEPEDEDFYFLTGDMPPVTRMAYIEPGSVKVNRNVGKKAPIINELLPNTAPPQVDAEDEFVEIYNPNDATFDLSGFKLAFGSNNPRKYTFPEGTVMQPGEFKVFRSGGTSISLSNTRAQVWLLDPNEKIIDQTEPYSSAKDGQAWALDSTTGKWVWSMRATPGEANILMSVPDKNAKSTTTAAILGISDSGSGSDSGTGGGSATATLADKTPIHPAVLAVVGLAAVAYAGYEYRQDIANKLFQFRQYRERRRALRPKLSRR